jgi:regulator of sigma E protease
VLPVPVLDGGHLAFLLIEKLKGSPVSERVQSASQIVGIVLVGLLILYVTFNDIQRLISN